MPRSPLAPISTAEQVRPAAPMSWIATTAPVCHQLQAGLQQPLLGEGVADLHGRALLLDLARRIRPTPWSRRRRRRGRSWRRDRRPAARRPRPSSRKMPSALRDAEREGVDQAIAVVAAVEVHLAADRRHAEGIAVAADAGDDARHEVARARMVGIAEAERVQRRDRPRAHGEDVAQDAADAGRRALVGLDVGGVVVALHLEDGDHAVADVDDAGVLAGAEHHDLAGGRQRAQPFLRGSCTSSARSTWPRRCRARSASARGRSDRGCAGTRPA